MTKEFGMWDRIKRLLGRTPSWGLDSEGGLRVVGGMGFLLPLSMRLRAGTRKSRPADLR